MGDTTYNGWKNYPTWAVNLWLSNDEGLYREVEIRIRTRLDSGTGGISIVADDLKEWVEEMIGDMGASGFVSDLLGYAVDIVDWRHIALSWAIDLDYSPTVYA